MKNNIKKLRMQAELKQETLAKMIGLSRPNLSLIERGKVIPNGLTMLKLAKALNVAVEDIFLLA